MLPNTKRLITPLRLGLVGLLVLTLNSVALRAQLPASSIPPLVQAPYGINYGGTSFFDGFSTRKPGFALLTYTQFVHDNSVTNSYGAESPTFKQPVLNATAEVLQFSWYSPLHLRKNLLGFNVITAIVGQSTSYGSGGAALTGNGTQLGDLTFGPVIQFAPIRRHDREVASFRIAANGIAPVGGFDKTRVLNQSSGYWSFEPYVAATLLPSDHWEVSTRIQYLYNLTTTHIAAPPPIPGFTFNNGRAGQMFVPNFDASYSITKSFALGGNGFGLLQFENNQINGISIPDSQGKALFLGPGAHWKLNDRVTMNLNVYLPVTTRNFANGPNINAQLIIPLHR
jgi:hypothetical protein